MVTWSSQIFYIQKCTICRPPHLALYHYHISTHSFLFEPIIRLRVTSCLHSEYISEMEAEGRCWVFEEKGPGQREFHPPTQYPFENGHPRPYDPPHSAPTPLVPAPSEAINCICGYMIDNGFNLVLDMQTAVGEKEKGESRDRWKRRTSAAVPHERNRDCQQFASLFMTGPH